MLASLIPNLLLLLIFDGSDESFLITRDESKVTEETTSKDWALLVAGSNGWHNYRHQADICHAYQIFHRNGIPDSNIVVMMYDDIANNTQNPDKGVIYNELNGPNVYKGVLKDYTKEDVTPRNFLHILEGNEAAMKGIGSGKVIKSGSNDRIFVNMVDHGSTGVFAFPSSFLLAHTLVNHVDAMYRNYKFKEMTFYVESCESGSMFSGLLPVDINVLGVTASTPYESSYACCYDPTLQVYLGDLFSVSWMDDTDAENPATETFEQQFEIVSNDTKGKETPSRYGDLSIDNETLSNFMGSPNVTKRHDQMKDDKELRKENAVKSLDVPFHVLENRLRSTKSEVEKDHIRNEIIQLHKNRIFLTDKVEEIIMKITMNYDLVMKYMEDKPTSISDWDCYQSAVQDFHDKCFNLGTNSFALRWVGAFSNLCNHGYSVKEIQEAIFSICDHPPLHNII